MVLTMRRGEVIETPPSSHLGRELRVSSPAVSKGWVKAGGVGEQPRVERERSQKQRRAQQMAERAASTKVEVHTGGGEIT